MSFAYIKKHALKSFPFIFICSLTGIAFSVFHGYLDDGFRLDDLSQVVNNPWIVHFSYIPTIFSSKVWGFMEGGPDIPGYYRPLMHVVYSLEYHLFSLDAKYWHAVNIAWHAVNSFLVFLLSYALLFRFFRTPKKSERMNRKIVGGISMLASLIFLVHPINSEVVEWIAAAPELGYTSCILIALFLYVHHPLPSAVHTMMTAAAFFLGLLFKETASMFLFLTLSYEYLTISNERYWKIALMQWLKKNGYYILILIIYLLLRPQGDDSRGDIMMYARAISDIFVDGPMLLLRNIQHIVFPFDLHMFYMFTVASLQNILVAMLLYGGLLFVFLRGYILQKQYILFSKYPFVLFCFALFVLPLIPSFASSKIAFSILSDRYLYFSSIGFSLVIAYFFSKIWISHTDRVTRVLLLILAASLLVVYVFIDQYRVFTQHLPWNAVVENALQNRSSSGVVYISILNDSAYCGDLASFDRVHAFMLENPDLRVLLEGEYFDQFTYNQAYAYLINGRLNEASALYERLLRDIGNAKGRAGILRDMSVLSVARGERETAEDMLMESWQSDMESFSTNRTLGIFYCRLGETARSEEFFNKALAIGDHVERIDIAKKWCKEGDMLKLYRDLFNYKKTDGCYISPQYK